MFVRVKTIKGKRYGYKVVNKWTKKGARQRVKGYLGRVHDFDKTGEEVFDENIEGLSSKKILRKLTKWELLRHEFKDEGVMKRDGIEVDLKAGKISCKGRKCCLEMNEGFMCDDTLKGLFNCKPKGDEDEVAYQLANICLEAGLMPPKPILNVVYNCIIKEAGIE